MPISGVAGARGRLLPHHRIAHCLFFGAPWSPGARFSGRVGTYSGRGAKARSRGILARFSFSRVYCVGVAWLPCQCVAAMLCPSTVPYQGETWHVVGVFGLLCWWAGRRHPLPFAFGVRFHTIPRARLAGGCERV